MELTLLGAGLLLHPGARPFEGLPHLQICLWESCHFWEQPSLRLDEMLAGMAQLHADQRCLPPKGLGQTQLASLSLA